MWGEHHVEFGLFDDLKPSSMFTCCGYEIVETNEPVDLHDTNLNDPSNISCALFEGLGLNNGRILFHLTSLRPSPMLLMRVL